MTKSRLRDGGGSGLPHPVYDLIIVGGGIHGATLGFQASRRGLRTLLIERSDFGRGASAGTLGIIHSGLRHLQALSFRENRRSQEALRWFTATLPSLVRPLPCLMPLYDRGLRRRSTFRIAFDLHRRLAPAVCRGQDDVAGTILSRDECLAIHPDVPRPGLVGGALWHDAQITDPVRVVRALISAAVNHGMVALERAEAIRLLTVRGCVTGLEALHRENGRCLQYSAPNVVLCAGAGTETLCAAMDPEAAISQHHALAFNLLVARQLQNRTALALSIRESGRSYFIRPWQDSVLAGTYYVPRDDLDTRPTPDEIQPFVDDLRRLFPAWRLSPEDVAVCPAGLLEVVAPRSLQLVHKPSTRNHGRHGGPVGLYSVRGVKFTTAPVVTADLLRSMGFGPDPGGAVHADPRSVLPVGLPGAPADLDACDR